MTLEVWMARDHGWSERDLQVAAERLGELSRYYGALAQRRHPERYGEQGVFTGIPRKRRGKK